MNIHHKRPKSRGGQGVRENLVAWHKKCHTTYHRIYGLRTSDNFGNPIGWDFTKRQRRENRRHGKHRR